jgi:hypothetical protein
VSIISDLARSKAMSTTLPERPTYNIFRRDRPGWIPEWVGDDWDPHPYVYQTDEELARLRRTLDEGR